MEIYKKSDIDLVEKNIEKIVEDIEKIRKLSYPRSTDVNENSDSSTNTVTEKKLPDRNDVDQIVKIVLTFIKEKKRKIYGGFGLNSIIKSKNKEDAFYSDDEIPDIDTYSPTPIEDLVEICDILYNNGFTDVFGTEAFHEGTYKIFTRGYNAIDLSYVPKMIYESIPFIEIDGVRYTSPKFVIIDFYRILSEPLFSSWRWSKVFKRLCLIQKYYPFKKINESVPKVYLHKINHEKLSSINNLIENYITNNNEIYLFGDIAFNYLVEETKIQNIKKVNVGIYQMVSTNYKKNAIDLINKFKNENINVTVKEYYPFWSFTGHSVEILFEGEVIIKIYNHLKRCCPVSIIKTKKGTIQLGCFDYLLLMEMVLSFREKVLRDNEKKKYHDIMISNLIRMREFYLNKQNKTLLDSGLFQSFKMSCIGDTIDPVTEARKQRKEKKEKKSSSFNYKPIRELKNKWVFTNTSGNEIHNPKNKKLKIN